MNKTYYIVIWKDHKGQIHRNEHWYGGKLTALFTFSDFSLKLPIYKSRLNKEKEIITLSAEYAYPKPYQTVLYIFTVKPR